MGVVALEERAAICARFDPLEAAYLDDPYPYLTEAREAAPVFYADSIDHWIVTRHRDIKQIFRDPPTYSAINANAPLRPPCPMAAKALEEGGWGAVPTLANIDPPAHTRVRRIANIAFTPKRVAEMEAFVRELTVRFCSERLRDGRADLVRISPGNCRSSSCSASSASTRTKYRALRKARGTASCSSTAARPRSSR